MQKTDIILKNESSSLVELTGTELNSIANAFFKALLYEISQGNWLGVSTMSHEELLKFLDGNFYWQRFRYFDRIGGHIDPLEYSCLRTCIVNTAKQTRRRLILEAVK